MTDKPHNSKSNNKPAAVRERDGGPMKRALLLAVALGVSSCATHGHYQISKSEIEASTKRILAEREGWMENTHCYAEQESDGSWRVVTHQFDTRKTECGCLLYLPDTGREILFKPSGKLIGYARTP